MKFSFRINILSILVSILVGVFGVSIDLAQASIVKIASEQDALIVSGENKIDIVINTEGERINALEGELLIPKNSYKLISFDDGNSIINFWLEKLLAIDDEKSPNIIVRFSGIIPGGYTGENGKIFSVKIIPLLETSEPLQIKNLKILLNDGKGTPAKAEFNEQSFKFTKQDVNKGKDEEIDTTPPESFTPQIVESRLLFDGKKALVFSTQDKNSGIAYYELQEGDGEFAKAESPYLLNDQSDIQKIIVKAVDKSGNIRLATIEDKIQIPLIIIIFFVLACLIFLLILMKQKRKKGKKKKVKYK